MSKDETPSSPCGGFEKMAGMMKACCGEERAAAGWQSVMKQMMAECGQSPAEAEAGAESEDAKRKP